jgi:xanthine/CO dehydrogenase XdhC/CoxF family maturation factor
MNDLGPILSLWRELERAGTDYVLATVVAVEGSSYRKTGACMLLAQDCRRAGTVSGGCLEGEVAKRAWWLTSQGPVVERYSTQDDEDERPYGSGCGGVVFLLLERKQTAGPLLALLENAFTERNSIAIATILDGPHMGERRALTGNGEPKQVSGRQLAEPFSTDLDQTARVAFETRTSFEQTLPIEGVPTRVLADYRPARHGLWIFGAGDDAKPLAQFAQGLGWFVAVADGRSHLATRDRFPSVDDIRVLPIFDLPQAAPHHIALHPRDAAVVMTHSYDQDSHILASLLATGAMPAYLGVLGPQRRTRELLREAAQLLKLPESSDRVEKWLGQMNAPTGLDLGADTPAAIALSVLAEVQQVLGAGTGQPLRTVRASREPAVKCEVE